MLQEVSFSTNSVGTSQFVGTGQSLHMYMLGSTKQCKFNAYCSLSNRRRQTINNRHYI